MNNTQEDIINRENARFYKLPVEQIKDRVGVGEIKALHKPRPTSAKEENGQLTIIGGSSLFHGAPLLALTTASRLVDMVFFSSPKEQRGFVNKLNSSLYSFIWVPEKEVDYYIQKSDAILIGPGMMRYSKQITDNSQQIKVNGDGKRTKELTERLLTKFPQKRWIIDAGSLQTMDEKFIPEAAILTPNRREFAMLFGMPKSMENAKIMAKKYHCIVVNKGAEASVCSPSQFKHIGMPQGGLTKGGTGDVTAGLIVAFACKNDPFLAACAGTFLVKLAAQKLSEKVANFYNADDLAKAIPETYKWCLDF